MTILTTQELAEKIKVTRATIINWRARGLPYLKVDANGAVRYVWEDVLEWLRGQQGSSGKVV